MSTLTTIGALPLVSTLSLSLSQIIINETSANNTLSRMTVGNFASQFLPTGPLISNAGGTIAALDIDPLLTISSIGTDGLGTLTFGTLTAGELLGNPNPSTGHVVAAPLTTYMDTAFGSAEGEIVYRGPGTWTSLTPGTAGQVLTTAGSGAPPSWTTPSGAALQVTDGTHTVTGVNDLVLSTGLSLTASGTGTATLLGSGGGGGGTLTVTNGTTSVAATTLTLSTGLTLAVTGSNATVTAGGGGGGGGGPSVDPVWGVFFSAGAWQRPALSALTVFNPNAYANFTVTEPNGANGPIVLSYDVSSNTGNILVGVEASATGTITKDFLMTLDVAGGTTYNGAGPYLLMSGNYRYQISVFNKNNYIQLQLNQFNSAGALGGYTAINGSIMANTFVLRMHYDPGTGILTASSRINAVGGIWNTLVSYAVPGSPVLAGYGFGLLPANGGAEFTLNGQLWGVL